MITTGPNHSFDLRFWVELRGFEPLTPLDANEAEAARPSASIVEKPGQRRLFGKVGSGSGRLIQKMISQIPPS
jgi:hypothetical protein